MHRNDEWEGKRNGHRVRRLRKDAADDNRSLHWELQKNPPSQHHKKLMWMLNTVSSRFRAVPARSSRGLRELTNLTVRIFGKRELSVELLCSAVGRSLHMPEHKSL